MRAVVAEDSIFNLTRLERILRGCGYEVDAVRDGLAAWKCLEKSAGAAVAILNCNLPGKGGLEITGELRSRSWPHYTYVILLSSQNADDGVLAALDAGADGFLALPVSAERLAAQLKIAERILKRDERFYREIADLQEQLRTHTAQPSPPDPDAVPQKPSVPAIVPTEESEENTAEDPGATNAGEVPKIPVSLLSGTENTELLSQVQACFAKALRRIRYVSDEAVDHVFEEPPDFTVYSALVLEDQKLWLDVKMEMPRHVATAIYRALMSEAPHSDVELCDALEEVCNRCHGIWQQVWESSDLQPITAGWPTARPTHEIPHCSSATQLGHCSFTLPGPIRVTIIEQLASVLDKPLSAVSPGDVLADPLSTVGQKLPLLKRGSVLNAKYISRIRDLLACPPEEEFKLRVIEPSPLALLLRRRTPRRPVESSLTVHTVTEGRERQLFGRVHDISESGLGATVFDALNTGQNVALDFDLSGVEFRIEAIVRHRQGSRCGFEFLSIPSKSQTKLREIVKCLPA